MGKILVIDDDRNIQEWIEKIFPNEDLRIIKTFSQNKEGVLNSQVPVLDSRSPVSMEDAVRAFLREEVTKSSWGNIHDKVIGKIEKALIGMILEEERGNQVRASKRLGINRNTLRKKMKDLQITTRVVTGNGEN
jgi:two-component system, NtrC family, nitrogen regulation response regulator GlnG